jgi:type IV pilus assembly protein PilV
MGLVEVLVAVLIFAVGLLGMAAMQLAAKKSSYEATQRSIATSLSRDILERMRSNPGEIAAYVAADVGDTSSPPATPGTDCAAATCTPAQLAAHDLYDWYQLLIGASESIDIAGTASNAGGLVEPRACISDVSGLVTVAIAWRGVNEMTNPAESDCGDGDGLYGTSDAQRRLLVMTTYIGNP